MTLPSLGGKSSLRRRVAAFVLAGFVPAAAIAAEPPADRTGAAAQPGASGEAERHYDIYEFRVDGSQLLSQAEVEAAVYDYLGPQRTAADVEKARDALEKAYRAKGYQTVAVDLPPQDVKDGIVHFSVVEGKVGRLRVRGSHYFSLDAIKEAAPSLAEGTVPNFNDVSKDIVALNALPDRRVTPALRAGVTPGTVDVDLNVEDKLPLHGSLELNNRFSENTVPLRLDASVSYDNLWQLGHSLSLSYQVAPQNVAEAQVFSASYLARFSDPSWLSLLVYGLKNESNVASLGSSDVVGRGATVGTRALITLPGEQGFYQSLSMGIDYKHVDQDVTEPGSPPLLSPVTYDPITASYAGTWQDDDALTQLDAGITLHSREMGGASIEFENQRHDAKADFIYFRGDLSRQQDVAGGFQLYGKVQGQVADEPLLNTEQFAAGGLDTVRGYLESEVLGDNGWLASFEARSPSLSPWFNSLVGRTVSDEWRFYLFAEGGHLNIYDALVDQQPQYDLASVGAGSRGKLLDYLNGSIDVGVPLINGPVTRSDDPQVTFRVWGEF